MHIEITAVIKFNALSHLLFLSIQQCLPQEKTQQSEEGIQKHVMLKSLYICGPLVPVGFMSPQHIKQILLSSK